MNLVKSTPHAIVHNCIKEKLFELEKMFANLSTVFMDIDPTVWVLASVALMVEAEEHFATVLTKGGSVVGVLLKDVHDARVQLGALLLLNFSMFRQPVELDLKYMSTFKKFSDSHAFWAVVYDLVVAPLVQGHLAALAGKTLTNGIH